ncbi:MAG: DUF1232 domain-containing protein [Chthonomonas sp.]|nr:DUF1232 domain-containing protein [Chthonomonas sp.]
MVRAFPRLDGIVRLFRALRDPGVPAWIKFLPLLAIVYWLFPIDIIPDPIIIVGWLDDLVVAWTLVSQSIRGLQRYAQKSLPERSIR